MDENTTPTSAKKQWLDTPRAIIIAGLIIAIGVGVGLSYTNKAPAADGLAVAPQTEEEVLEELAKSAKSVGVQKDAFMACMEGDMRLSKIEGESMEAGMQGTPYNVLVGPQGTVAIPGALPYEAFEEVIKGLTGEEPFEIPEQFQNTLSDDVLVIREGDHVRGNPDAPVKIFEYSDLDCPFCKSVHPTLTRLTEEYPDTVVWIYRHHPLEIHPMAIVKAEASECVATLGDHESFWKFIDLLFK